MSAIVDISGNPIDTGMLKEPQTASIERLRNAWLTPMLDGLTPARLVEILRQADTGYLTAQHRLFADMEERDPHMTSEIGKRKNALLNLDWDIVPPRNPSAAEKSLAEWVKEILTDAVDPIEDLLLALMDGVGHGFAPVELEWRQEGGELLPAFFPRPQEWFRLSRDRRELRLLDSSSDGAVLQPFGWAMHTHGKAKTGYLGRMGLHRVLVWPFLYKAYGVGDFAEFLETYGLPIIVGKYNAGTSADEKDSLMAAVTALGHDARAIMPVDMQLEINKIAGSGEGTPHMTMIEWADKAESKAILGQTLTAETGKGGGGSFALGKIHNEVRRDIQEADAREVAGTVTRDIIYPLIALNKGGIDGLKRCPRLVFDVSQREDIAAYSDALPKLAALFNIPAPWARERLGIPAPEDGEEILRAPAAPAAAGGNPNKPPDPATLTALSATPGEPNTPDVQLADQLAIEAAPAMDVLIADIRLMAANANSLEELRDGLLAAYADLPADKLTAVMSLGFAVADLVGRDQVGQGS